jgi:hypothetical protein
MRIGEKRKGDVTGNQNPQTIRKEFEKSKRCITKSVFETHDSPSFQNDPQHVRTSSDREQENHTGDHAESMGLRL